VEDFVNEFAGENVRRKQQEFQNIAPSFTHAKRSTHASTIFLKERTGALHAKRSIKQNIWQEPTFELIARLTILV